MINDVKNCSGCGLCYANCPVNAIHKVERERGIIYFEADETCLKCGKCIKLCPTFKDMKHDEQETFLSAITKDKKAKKYSSSGGAAYEISKEILNRGGVVYGASWDIQSQSVKHSRVSFVNDLYLLQGSKYVQSEIDRETYNNVLNDLKDKKVLFIGCPCQVAAIRSLCGDHENLYTIDIVCHGVSSPKLLKDQLDLIVHEPVKEVSFRDGLRFRLRVETENEIYEERAGLVPYYSLYLNFASLRETCYSCGYANRRRVGDITVGDYIENGMGKSLIISNTDNGKLITQSIKERMDSVEHDINLLTCNHSFNKPTDKPAQTQKFTKLYSKYGLKRAYEATFRKQVFKRKIQSLVGEETLKKIKKIIKG